MSNLISLKVDNFPFETTTNELTDLFSKYGEVKDCYLPKDHATGNSRGFGFVRFGSQEEADAAIKGCRRSSG